MISNSRRKNPLRSSFCYFTVLFFYDLVLKEKKIKSSVRKRVLSTRLFSDLLIEGTREIRWKTKENYWLPLEQVILTYLRKRKGGWQINVYFLSTKGPRFVVRTIPTTFGGTFVRKDVFVTLKGLYMMSHKFTHLNTFTSVPTDRLLLVTMLPGKNKIVSSWWHGRVRDLCTERVTYDLPSMSSTSLILSDFGFHVGSSF